MESQSVVILSYLCDNVAMSVHERIIRTYVAANGQAPFERWFDALRDKQTKARILARIDRLRLGNFGDCRSIGGGVYELRIHTGPGFRVYGSHIVLLLCGGDKGSQARDIANAQQYWQEHQQNDNKEL